MILDTSIILALFFKEATAERIAALLQEHADELCMSTVNMAEVLILLRDRQPRLYDDLREQFMSASIRFIPPTTEHAELAAQARLAYPLNLGDCFAYALARTEKAPLLTLDTDFRKTDIDVVIPA